MEAANRGVPSTSGGLIDAPREKGRWQALVTQARQAVAQRRPAESVGCLEEALTLARRDWPASRQHAESCVRLADLRAAFDRRDDALQLYGEAVGALAELPDGADAMLAHAVSNMGRMYLLRGDSEKGLELAVAAEALLRKLDLPDTPSTALNLAMARAHAGDETAACKAFGSALAALDRLEPADPQGIAVHDNYALYCLSIGEAEKAESLLRHSLILRQEAAGPRHPTYAGGLVNLGRMLHLFGEKQEEAEALLWQAKDVYEQGAGVTNTGLLSALYYLARIAQDGKRRDEAGQLCNSMVENCSGDQRSAKAAEAASLHVTARLWSAQGSGPAETETRLRRALELAESLSGGYRRLGVDVAAGVLADLSELMRSEKRLPETERLAVRAAEMRGRLLWSVSRHVFTPPD